MDGPANKRTKIQAPELRSVKFSQSESQSSAGIMSHPGDQANVTFDAVSSSSLAELCDSRYMHGKGKLGKRLTGPTSDNNRKNSGKTAEIKQQASFTASTTPSASQSSQTTQSNKSGLRVEMIDGKMVIKESSLIVNDTTINETEYEEVEEGALVTSRYSSFTNRRSAKAWGIEETRLFYNALRQCGLEFSLMQSFFPNRTRKEIKLKFRREERQHPELIKKALETSLPLELTPFELQLGEEISYQPTVTAAAESS